MGIVADRIVGTLSICSSVGIANHVIFSFNYAQEWEQRVLSWFVNLLCWTMGELSLLGLNCEQFPRQECLLQSQSGVGSISVNPLRLSDINKSIVYVSIRLMCGTDVHSFLNHLQTRMKDFVKNLVLLSCPKLHTNWASTSGLLSVPSSSEVVDPLEFVLRSHCFVSVRLHALSLTFRARKYNLRYGF